MGWCRFSRLSLEHRYLGTDPTTSYILKLKHRYLGTDPITSYILKQKLPCIGTGPIQFSTLYVLVLDRSENNTWDLKYSAYSAFYFCALLKS